MWHLVRAGRGGGGPRSCGTRENVHREDGAMSRVDPHSYYDSDQPRTQRLSLKWNVDFAHRSLDGSVTLELASEGSGPLDLDTKGLTIRSAQTGNGTPVRFELGE